MIEARDIIYKYELFKCHERSISCIDYYYGNIAGGF